MFLFGPAVDGDIHFFTHRFILFHLQLCLLRHLTQHVKPPISPSPRPRSDGGTPVTAFRERCIDKQPDHDARPPGFFLPPPAFFPAFLLFAKRLVYCRKRCQTYSLSRSTGRERRRKEEKAGFRIISKMTALSSCHRGYKMGNVSASTIRSLLPPPLPPPPPLLSPPPTPPAHAHAPIVCDKNYI